ncbi:MAG: thioredoxin domain-containing protein, partial [Chloroflexota bacterium]
MYVKTGIVRVGYFHMAFLGPESKWAAEASECAGEQGKFWEYYDKLFVSHAGENQGAFSKDNLKKFAADLKLDAAKFNTCLDSGKYSSTVENDTAFAQSLGISSTYLK